MRALAEEGIAIL